RPPRCHPVLSRPRLRAPERLDGAAGSLEPESHRVDAEMGDAAHRPPRHELPGPRAGRHLGEREAAFDAEGRGLAADVLDLSMQAMHDRLTRRTRPGGRGTAW